VEIFFEMDPTVQSPPEDQLTLKRDIERLLHALRTLFILPDQEQQFRPFYAQLLSLAQLGLAGPTAAPAIASRALDNLTSELIDDQGARVKNGHIRRLAGWAALYSVPCLIVYALLSTTHADSATSRWLLALQIDSRALASFMLLWVGSFIGVVLSYGSRTTTMSLADLVTVDADRLRPSVRLLFAGTLTMIFGILLFLGIVELKIGTVSSTHVGSNSLVAFVVGSLCGISELLLPGTVTKKAGDLLGIK